MYLSSPYILDHSISALNFDTAKGVCTAVGLWICSSAWLASLAALCVTMAWKNSSGDSSLVYDTSPNTRENMAGVVEGTRLRLVTPPSKPCTQCWETLRRTTQVEIRHTTALGDKHFDGMGEHGV